MNVLIRQNKKRFLFSIIFIIIIVFELYTILTFIGVKHYDYSKDYRKGAKIKTDWHQYTIIEIDKSFDISHIYYEKFPNYPWHTSIVYEKHNYQYVLSKNTSGLIPINEEGELNINISNLLSDRIIEKKLLNLAISDIFNLIIYLVGLVSLCVILFIKDIGNKLYKSVILTISMLTLFAGIFYGYEQMFIISKLIISLM